MKGPRLGEPMSWFKANELALQYAATARHAAKGLTVQEQLVAEIQASALERFAAVLKANGSDEDTNPRIVAIPPEAKGEP